MVIKGFFRGGKVKNCHILEESHSRKANIEKIEVQFNSNPSGNWQIQKVW